MSKSDRKFVNLEQEWELNDWLKRNGYPQTEERRKWMKDLVNQAKKSYGKKSSDNLTWEELDKFHAKK